MMRSQPLRREQAPVETTIEKPQRRWNADWGLIELSRCRQRKRSHRLGLRVTDQHAGISEDQQFRDQRVEVWGVSQDNAKESEGFAKEFGLSFPVLIDENDYAVSTEYGLEYVPSYFLIAAGGKIEISGDGFSKRDFLAIQRLLAARLAAKPPALFQTTEMVPEFKPG